MDIHVRQRLFLPAALLGGVAVFAAVFFVALAVHSVVADPSGPVPNPGHAWTEIQGHGDDADACYVSTEAGQAFEVRVNNERVLRLEPGISVIGGYSGNAATDGAGGAAIGGGGESGLPNRVTDQSGTVGGGIDNTAGNDDGNAGNAEFATVGGGRHNNASGPDATVGGGWGNTASGDSATVGGGDGNDASAPNATVGGGQANWASANATVAGGASNSADFFGTIGGGGWNTAENEYATVGGGHNNIASEMNATVGGGDTNIAFSNAATVGGGYLNTASGVNATVGGGQGNEASGWAATIAGGGRSDFTDPATRNRVTDDYGTIGGGGNNQAGNGWMYAFDAQYATVAGGEANTASGWWTTVGGGSGNLVTDDHGTIGGGNNNQAGDNVDTTDTAPYATVGGGGWNTAENEYATVAGGNHNTASGNGATVAGGGSNIASGIEAAVPGGEQNTAAGEVSFAAGYRAKIDAAHNGTFLFADLTDFDFDSAAVNEFAVRSTGGARFVTGIDESGIPDAGVKLDPDDNAWEVLSDRDAKENFVVLDAQDVLNRLAGIPITEWNYKTQDPSNRHIGPMAQDFYAAFGLSADELYISPIDTDGVALAAIQGLYELSQEQDARIQALEARVAALEGGAPLERGSESLLSSIMPFGPLFLAGLVVGGLVLVQRRRAGGRS
jgi:hypothetical protein